MDKPIKTFRINWIEFLFLLIAYLFGLYFRLQPRLAIDPHLLTMNADIWERLAMAQYMLDHGRLPEYCLRYIAYGKVPFWYPPFGPIALAMLSKISALDLPTVCSRIIPFIESLAPLPFSFLARWLYGRCTGYISMIILTLTPAFIYWTGIATPASLTLFLLPIYIILLLLRSKNDNLPNKNRLFWILGLGSLLAINFLTHLTYFLALIILLFISLLLFIKTKNQAKKISDFFLAVLFSQIITAFWWAPKNLYWWWIFALTTSSGLQSHLSQLKDYGVITAILKIEFLVIYIFWVLRKNNSANRHNWLALVWMFLPFLETQNEIILKMFNRLDLSWSTLFKPLEGFRFFCFFAQPLALIVGALIARFIALEIKQMKTACVIVVIFLAGILTVDLNGLFKISGRFQNAGINTKEYEAAVWFRNNSTQNDRIIADYYRSQVLAGVCAGRALLGALFPLRNVNIPFVTVPAVVHNDIYSIYATPDPKEAAELMQTYGCSHIFISPGLITGGGFASEYKDGFGVDVDLKKFENRRYFTEVYSEPISKIRIFKLR
ncbi:MAG: hypothetical protein JSW17_05150 [Candidatus Omnitrophota bacterium]|nr:MAG: hypothetical protein JSW17_05150 [Candidatus Omnitrophota bacterium]